MTTCIQIAVAYRNGIIRVRAGLTIEANKRIMQNKCDECDLCMAFKQLRVVNIYPFRLKSVIVQTKLNRFRVKYANKVCSV